MSKESLEKVNSVIGLLQLFEQGKLKLKQEYCLTVMAANNECKSFFFVQFSSFYYNAKEEIDSIFFFTHNNDKRELCVDKKFFEGENGFGDVYIQLEASC